MGRKSHHRRTTRSPDTPWALLVTLVLLVIFLEALFSQQWSFVVGMVISALGAGSYYLYVDRGRTDRRLWLGANSLLIASLAVLVAALIFG